MLSCVLLIGALLSRTCNMGRGGVRGAVMNIDNICYDLHNFEKRKGSLMASGSIHVKVSGALQDHIQQQIGDEGLYENASEYIRALIRRDLHTRDEAWEALQRELAPAMRADDSEFVAVTADDVIRRNKRS